MNIPWILVHLEEAHQELARVIEKLQTAEDRDETTLSYEMAHIYHHLNTAWNARAVNGEQIAAMSDSDFDMWRAFPTDLE